MSTSRSGKRLPKCSARWKHACRKPQFKRGSGWLRAGAQRVQAANEDIHRDGVDLVVIHRVEKGRAHFVKHKSADQRAQYRALIAGSRSRPALSNTLTAMAVSNSTSRRPSGESARSDAIRRSQRVASVASNSSMENFFSFAGMDQLPPCPRERRGLEIPDAVLAPDRRHSAASR